MRKRNSRNINIKENSHFSSGDVQNYTKHACNSSSTQALTNHSALIHLNGQRTTSSIQQ